MGLPEIHIEFEEKKTNFIHRLGRGMVAIAFVDAAYTTPKTVVCDDAAEVATAVNDLPSEKKTVVEAEMVRALNRGAAKAIAVCAKDVTTVESALSAQKFNYLAIGNLQASDQTTLVTWAKARGFMCGRHFIVIGNHGLANSADAHVVALDGQNLKDAECTTAALAGVFAGLSQQSGTYYVMNPNCDGTGFATREQADSDVDKGIVTVFFDGEKAKISRAVTTYYATEPKSPLAKIRNVDTMNMIKDDIKESFENDYVGKVPNSYANKMTLIGMINQMYLDGLKGDVLNPDYDNAVDIDVEAHKRLAKSEDAVVSEMSEMDLRRYDTGSVVYLAGTICFLDTMEDLTISFVIE